MLSRKKNEFEGNSLNFPIFATAPQRQKGKSPGGLLAPFLVRFVGSCSVFKGNSSGIITNTINIIFEFLKFLMGVP